LPGKPAFQRSFLSQGNPHVGVGGVFASILDPSNPGGEVGLKIEAGKAVRASRRLDSPPLLLARESPIDNHRVPRGQSLFCLCSEHRVYAISHIGRIGAIRQSGRLRYAEKPFSFHVAAEQDRSGIWSNFGSEAASER